MKGLMVLIFIGIMFMGILVSGFVIGQNVVDSEDYIYTEPRPVIFGDLTNADVKVTLAEVEETSDGGRIITFYDKETFKGKVADAGLILSTDSSP